MQTIKDNNSTDRQSSESTRTLQQQSTLETDSSPSKSETKENTQSPTQIKEVVSSKIYMLKGQKLYEVPAHLANASKNNV